MFVFLAGDEMRLQGPDLQREEPGQDDEGLSKDQG